MASDPVSIRDFAYNHRVDIETVRGWIKAKRIPFVAVNGRIMVYVGDIIQPIGGTNGTGSGQQGPAAVSGGGEDKGVRRNPDRAGRPKAK